MLSLSGRILMESWEWCCRGGFCEKTSEASRCWQEPVSASSEVDPLLPKAESISNASGAFVIMYFRKSEKCCAAAVRGMRTNVKEAAL